MPCNRFYEGSPRLSLHLLLNWEEKNILSPYHYNLLFGDELSEGEYSTYYLDSENIKDIEVEIENSERTIKLTKQGENAEYKVGDYLKKANIILDENRANELENNLEAISSSGIDWITRFWSTV